MTLVPPDNVASFAGNSALPLASLALPVAVLWVHRQFPPVLGEKWVHQVECASIVQLVPGCPEAGWLSQGPALGQSGAMVV